MNAFAESALSAQSARPSPYALKASPYGSHARLMEAFAAEGNGRRVVDVGGGEGYLSRALVERGYQVVCVAQPGTASPTLPARIEVVETDLNRDELSLDGRFSHALCGDVLEHLVDPLDVLRRLNASLEDGGTLVASLPNGANWYVRLNVLLGRFPEDDKGLFDRTHLHFYAWANWARLLERAGFEVESLEPTSLPFDLALPRIGRGWLGGALEAMNYWMARVWKELWAYQFVVVARKKLPRVSVPLA